MGISRFKELFRACGARGYFARRRDLLDFVSDGPLSFNSERKGGKNASKNYVFAFPRRAVAICKFAALSHAFTEPLCCRAV